MEKTMKYQLIEKFKNIWWKSLEYQDFRNDRGHAFIVTIYAQQISIDENCNADIVVPSAILHDIGWSQLTEYERMLIFNKNSPKEERLKIRIKHQDESVRLAKNILISVNYKTEHIPEILEIIEQHDTRDGFINKNEGAMRDADKLWRFDDYGFLNDNQNSKITFKDHIESLQNYLETDKFFYFKSSLEKASDLLAEIKLKYKD